MIRGRCSIATIKYRMATVLFALVFAFSWTVTANADGSLEPIPGAEITDIVAAPGNLGQDSFVVLTIENFSGSDLTLEGASTDVATGAFIIIDLPQGDSVREQSLLIRDQEILNFEKRNVSIILENLLIDIKEGQEFQMELRFRQSRFPVRVHVHDAVGQRSESLDHSC